MYKKILFLMVLNTVSWSTSSCEMLVNQPAYVKENLGTMNLSSTGSNYIWLSKSNGDKTAIFNTDDLYEVTDAIGSRYFRLNGDVYNHTGSGQTFIYDLAYAFGVQPPNGNYTVKSYTTERKLTFGRTLDTVGDSITWWQQGRFLRCLMRDSGLMYDFRGGHYDVFGFGHDGLGGNTSQNILDRMVDIPIEDAYFLLIGTNDRIDPQDTVNNIKAIVLGLKSKKPCGKVYYSTLLPRTDEYNTRNQAINVLLRALPPLCDGCILIDTGSYFYALANWQAYLADGLHPTYAGYQKISAYIAPLIN